MLFHCEICHKSFCWWNFTAPRVVHSTEITFTKNFNFAPGHSRSQYWNHSNKNVDVELSMSSIDLAHFQLDTGTVHSFLILFFSVSHLFHPHAEFWLVFSLPLRHIGRFSLQVHHALKLHERSSHGDAKRTRVASDDHYDNRCTAEEEAEDVAEWVRVS